MVSKSDMASAGRVVALAALAALCTAASLSAQTTIDRPVTFTKDVAPILQAKCQQCHRPDSIAPMSLITYEQTRPYARAIKQRVQMAYVPGMRGVMPPWLLERNIGIQKLREDISLTDEQIAIIAKWVDSGAPQGNAADMPPAVAFIDNSRWFLGKPDLIMDSPPVLVKGVAVDWWGDVGDSAAPAPLTEDRYAMSAEYKETSKETKDQSRPAGLKSNATSETYAGQGKYSLFAWHHGSASVRRPTVGAGGPSDNEAEGGVGALSLHEVGRNGDQFPADAGKLVPAGAIFAWNGHIHAPGIPGADRNAVLSIGLRFHPRGYKPAFQEAGVQIGTTEIEVRTDSPSQRYDAYWVAPQPLKMLNFEPHLHATGMRMCIEAIYERSKETLSCAGYDHNWVRNYQYEDNSTPILPKGTILHTITWFDGTAKNANIIDPRNETLWGRRSVQNMLGVFNKAFMLSEEQYRAEIAKRKQYLESTNSWNTVIGCPGCLEQQGRVQAANSGASN